MTATTEGLDAPRSQPPKTDREVGDELIREGKRDPMQQYRRQITDDAKKKILSLADDQKGEAASLLRDVADALHAFTSRLNERGRGKTAEYVDIAADRLQQFGDELPNRDLGQTLRQMEVFAREHPTVFFGGLMLVGFAAARFLRASAGSTDDGGYSSAETYAPPTSAVSSPSTAAEERTVIHAG